jgi:predicted O-linked N-acetylglucosamine transferase (SPINDLY family)
VEAAQRAIDIDPNSFEAYNNLGNALSRMREFESAIAAYHRSIQIKPDYLDAMINLAVLWKSRGKLDEAMTPLRRAAQLNPQFSETYNQLGNVLKDMGQMDRSIASYRRAVSLRPNDSSVHSNLLYALHFDPAYDAKMILEEHRRWNGQHAEPLRKLIRPHKNEGSADRPLRIGYVSPDFCYHPVGRFIWPLLAGHDRKEFEIVCYADVARPDRLTEKIRDCAGQWKNTLGLSNDAVAAMIREDQIDILVDLTMHMAGNRMLVFAQKPAPVQATYLAYCSTTGVSAIDYRLTDPHLDPPGMEEGVYSEKTVRLPETYWCYELDAQAPEVTPCPAQANGFVTFGSLNNFCKVSPGALDAWVRLLQAVPKSQLILHAPEGGHRQRVGEMFKSAGIDPQRVMFFGKVPFVEFLGMHGEIDIALDPFPCCGGTTTLDAAWMGVPTVTLSGRTAVGRSGVSILRNLGLPELIAESVEQYVQIAGDLAMDLPRLAELRMSMRERMRGSAIMDRARFARGVERAYRGMWGKWKKV